MSNWREELRIIKRFWMAQTENENCITGTADDLLTLMTAANIAEAYTVKEEAEIKEVGSLEDAICLTDGHIHASRLSEAICSLRFQLQTQSKALIGLLNLYEQEFCYRYLSHPETEPGDDPETALALIPTIVAARAQITKFRRFGNDNQ